MKLKNIQKRPSKSEITKEKALFSKNYGPKEARAYQRLVKKIRFEKPVFWWKERNLIQKLTILLITSVLLIVSSMYGIARWYIASQAHKEFKFGATFIPTYARSFNLAPEPTMQAMIDDLNIRHFRLVSYWNEIEKTPGQYDFTELDWQFKKVEAVNGTISLAIGLRQPRWPECHIPDWYLNKPKSEWYPPLKVFMKKVIEHYKNSPALESYQLENEYFLKVFGECPDFSRDRLIDEAKLVKQEDPKHTLIISRSNNALGLPIGQPQPDKFGVSYSRGCMLNIFLKFASDGPQISLSPETLVKIGGFNISNSVFYGFICSVILILITIIASKKIRLKAAKGITQFIEMAMEFVIGLVEGPLGSREKAAQYAPIFGTYFLFIIFNNIMGIMPWVGKGINATTSEGTFPLFRAFTADLNGTIAMGVIAVVTVITLAIKESGFIGHLKHYFTDKPLNPINMFIGFLEVFGEFSRMLSLSLRLFLNTVLGEVLISVFIYIGKDFQSFTVLPIVMFEILVACIQAYVFTVLAATYLGLAISHGHDDEHSAHEVDPIVAKLEGNVINIKS